MRQNISLCVTILLSFLIIHIQSKEDERDVKSRKETDIESENLLDSLSKILSSKENKGDKKKSLGGIEDYDIYGELTNKPTLPRPPGLWGKKEIDNGPPGLWGKREAGVPGFWGKKDIINGPPGLWGKREVVNGPPGLWGRDIAAGPPGLWGRDISQQRERNIDQGPPGLWGRDAAFGPPGLWGRDVSGQRVRDIEQGPPGLWGRDTAVGPPGLWGREISEENHDKQQGPPGLWGRDVDAKLNTKNIVKKTSESKLLDVSNDVQGPPGLWGREVENAPPGMWGKRSVKKLLSDLITNELKSKRKTKV